VEPEEKEDLGDSPTEERTMVRSQSKASEQRTPSSARHLGCDPHHRLGGLGEEGEH
jgi:hypothetical protein